MVLHQQIADTENPSAGSGTVNNTNRHASKEGSEGKSTDTVYEAPEIEHHWGGADAKIAPPGRDHRVLGDGTIKEGTGNIDDMI